MTTSAPSAPHPLPAQRVVSMLANPEQAQWHVPRTLQRMLPHASSFGFRVERTNGDTTLIVTVKLPLPEPSAKERARFTLPPGTHDFVVRVSEDALVDLLANLQRVGLVLDGPDAVAVLVGDIMASRLDQLPAPTPRPFIGGWIGALTSLSVSLSQMYWQRCALETSRDIVHRAKALVRNTPGITFAWERTGGAA